MHRRSTLISVNLYSVSWPIFFGYSDYAYIHTNSPAHIQSISTTILFIRFIGMAYAPNGYTEMEIENQRNIRGIFLRFSFLSASSSPSISHSPARHNVCVFMSKCDYWNRHNFLFEILWIKRLRLCVYIFPFLFSLLHLRLLSSVFVCGNVSLAVI